MAKINKIDLSLLKKLVGELELSLQIAEGIKSASEPDNNEYVVEMSKAAGLAAGVMQESSMLIVDIHALSSGASGAVAKPDLLDKILGPFKGGSTN